MANAHPNDWDGIIEWEGMLYSRNPQVLAINQGYCTTLQAQLAAGLVYDGVGTNVIKMAAELSDITPGGLTPIPLFPPNLTNHQTLVAILSTPTPGPATMPTPNYVLMNGSLAEDRLFNASEPRVYDDIARFNSYSPLSLVRDISCSLAGRGDPVHRPTSAASTARCWRSAPAAASGPTWRISSPCSARPTRPSSSSPPSATSTTS